MGSASTKWPTIVSQQEETLTRERVSCQLRVKIASKRNSLCCPWRWTKLGQQEPRARVTAGGRADSLRLTCAMWWHQLVISA